MQPKHGPHGVSNLKGPLVLHHGKFCVGCLKIAANVSRMQRRKR